MVNTHMKEHHCDVRLKHITQSHYQNITSTQATKYCYNTIIV